MKLRNKKTGEIIDFGSPAFIIDNNKNNVSMQIKNLAELNDDWEDYQEPKEYWYIEPNGVIARIDEWDCCTASDIESMKTLGNYFETREEAEKAVEKLKAWKRLKDKGFKFNGWEDSPAEDDFDMIWFTMKAKVWDVETQEDLDLLFGGEDDSKRNV